MIYNQYDVVVVPFPFSDTTARKRRPAVVISSENVFNTPSGHSVCLMITTSGAWPLDVQISDLNSAGLTVKSKMRMKIFTIDNSLIIRKAGSLSANDQSDLKSTLSILIQI